MRIADAHAAYRLLSRRFSLSRHPAVRFLRSPRPRVLGRIEVGAKGGGLRGLGRGDLLHPPVDRGVENEGIFHTAGSDARPTSMRKGIYPERKRRKARARGGWVRVPTRTTSIFPTFCRKKGALSSKGTGAFEGPETLRPCLRPSRTPPPIRNPPSSSAILGGVRRTPFRFGDPKRDPHHSPIPLSTPPLRSDPIPPSERKQVRLCPRQ
eukprot:scaffold1222_cov317-Pavlova_lutheri.AAC.4